MKMNSKGIEIHGKGRVQQQQKWKSMVFYHIPSDSFSATGRKWRSWLEWSKVDFYPMGQHHTYPHSIQSHLDNPRHLPDTSQTPSRHPTDTPTFWIIRGNWEKRKRLMYMSQIECLSIACTSYPPRQCPESLRQPQAPPRHLPDTLQTPSHFD